MKMKLRSLGVKMKSEPQEVMSKSTGTTERFPEVTLTSKEVKGLKEYAENGKKCYLEFVGEVTGFRSAGEWDIDNGLMAKDDVSVTIKLTKGEITSSEKAEDLNEAKHNAVKEYKE